MQGLIIVNGKGLQMAINPGTGFGTTLLMEGHLLADLELVREPVTKNKIIL